MRRNKVCPLDNGGKQPINAFDLGSNSDQQRDGVLRQPLIMNGEMDAEGPGNTSTPSSTIPQPHLLGASAAVGGRLQPLVSVSKKGQPLNEAATSDATLSLVSDSPPSSPSTLKRLIAVDRRSSEAVISGTEASVNAEQSVNVNSTWTISEESSSMAEQHEAGSSVEQDLLKYFTELNNNNSDIDMDEAARIVLEGADVNARGADGQTCMHLAACHWKKEVIQFLNEKGADLHELDDFNVTPLHEAARVDNEEVVSYLIKNSPNISHVTSDTCQTALHYAVLGSAINSIYVCMQAHMICDLLWFSDISGGWCRP